MSAPTLSKSAAAVAWTCQCAAAAILAQTLYFKFSAAPEPVYIFSTLGAEPWGRLGTGVAELAVALALLVPRTAALAALASMGMMLGALGAHLTRLGVEIRLPGAAQGDGGLLFVLAAVTLLASAVVAWLRRASLPWVGARLAARRS
ncbi:MAG: DoxX family protein [Planctomycetes bacterium]|nr:DoxX family protein [Planctomycetota bacterium]